MQQPPNPYSQYPQQQWQQSPIPPQQQWNPQEPPFPPQQYQQPPQYQPPMQPLKKKSRKRLWFIVAAVVLVLAVSSVVASQGQSQQPASTTQATQQPTTQPTTQAPTQPPAKITPQASIQSQLQSIVQKSGAAYVGGATVSYDASAKYAHVFENFPVTGDHSLDVSRIKQDAFAIQKAIWQAHVSGVDAVQVLFNSDAATPLRIATCELEQTTAVKLKWANITSDQAWSDYDTSWLSPSL
jgi:hypothetical protein